MKTEKRNLAILLIISFYGMYAQYGHKEYQNTWIMSSGERTFRQTNNDGFIMSSVEPTNTSFLSNSIRVDKTSISGVFDYIPSPQVSFEREYFLMNTSASGAYDIGTVVGTSAIELIPQSSGNWYALAGAYDNGSFLIFLAPDGDVTTFKHFPFPAGALVDFINPVITQDQNTGDIYLSGSYKLTTTSGFAGYLYTIKTDSVGNVIWSQIYDVNGANFEPHDMLVSPHNGELIIVGHISPDQTLYPGQGSDCFFLSLDPTNGAVNTLVDYSSTPCNWFNSISPAFSTQGGIGYVVGGHSDFDWTTPAQSTGLMMKLDLQGGIIWNTLIEGSSALSQTTGQVMGVVEKFGPQGYHYYGVAETHDASTQLKECSVFKLDDNGNPAFGINEYHYSPPVPNTVQFAPINLTDQPMPGSNDEGLQIYLNYGGSHFLIQSYYSGHSGCNELLTNILSTEPGPVDIQLAVTVSTGLTNNTDLDITTTFLQNSPIVHCNSSSLPGGSNARLISGVEEKWNQDNEILPYPNPSSGKFKIDIHSRSQVSIFDLTGKLIFSESYEASIQEFDLSEQENGMYFVEVNNNQKISRFKIVKE